MKAVVHCSRPTPWSAAVVLATSLLTTTVALPGAEAADEAEITHLVPSGASQGQQVEVLLLPRAQQPPVVRRALLYLIEQSLLRCR